MYENTRHLLNSHSPLLKKNSPAIREILGFSVSVNNSLGPILMSKSLWYINYNISYKQQKQQYDHKFYNRYNNIVAKFKNGKTILEKKKKKYICNFVLNAAK